LAGTTSQLNRLGERQGSSAIVPGTTLSEKERVRKKLLTVVKDTIYTLSVRSKRFLNRDIFRAFIFQRKYI
jgi:hypothetical protein